MPKKWCLVTKDIYQEEEKKIRTKSFRFCFFKLGIRGKTAQFLLTVESSCCFKEYSSLYDRGRHKCVQLSALSLQLIPV